jgi:hypothetical protein
LTQKQVNQEKDHIPQEEDPKKMTNVIFVEEGGIYHMIAKIKEGKMGEGQEAEVGVEVELESIERDQIQGIEGILDHQVLLEDIQRKEEAQVNQAEAQKIIKRKITHQLIIKTK